MVPTNDGTALRLDDLVFVGFNRRVAAIDRYGGEIRWQWKAGKGGGLVTLLLDGDRLIASSMGYTWCLDPLSGAEVWRQEFKGFGMGITCLASVRGSSSTAPQAAGQTASSSSGAPASTAS